MAILIGVVLALGAALAGLYFWLAGHWFARVLAFLVLSVICAFVGAGLVATAAGGVVAGPEVIAAVFGVTAAWFLAGIPTYVRRHRERQMWHTLTTSDLVPLDPRVVFPKRTLPQITYQPHKPRWWDNPV